MSSTSAIGSPGASEIEAALETGRLPLSAYSSDTFFELEREQLFLPSWVLVGRSDELTQVGDFLALDISDEPVLVARSPSGIVGTIRSCAHRSMPIVEVGRGHAGSFTCPYHSWTYELDGSRRNSDGCDIANGLRRIQVEEWLGFIFVNLDSSATPLRPRLTEVERALRPWSLVDAESVALHETVWSANWKLAVENASEAYHLSSVHNTPKQVAGGSRHGGSDRWWTLHRVDLETAAHHPTIDRLVDLGDDDRRAYRCYTIYPSTVILVSGAHCHWMTFLPQDSSHTFYRSGLLFPPAARPILGSSGVAQVHADLVRLADEDHAVVRAVQRYAGSRLAPTRVVTHHEPSTADFMRYVIDTCAQRRR